MKNILLIIATFLLFGIGTQTAFAEDPPTAPEPSPVQYEKGVVISVSQLDSSMQEEYHMQKGELVVIRLTSGPDSGKEVNTFNFEDERSPFSIKVNAGDKIIVAITNDLGHVEYHVSDFDRFNYLCMLLAIFVGCLIIVSGMVGIRSVLVIGFSIVLILKFYIGQVLAGHINMIILTLLVCTVIAIVTQVSISGWNRKSLAAILGTVGGVILAGLLSMAAIHLMHLTGLDSEEAMMLKASRLYNTDFQGVLFSGMVFGALGAVMDVSISIASALQEIKLVQPELGMKKLFSTGMNVGRDIMGTMSNTLILAYTGSSLPLMLLIALQQDVSILRLLNLNLIVTEVTRALTGSIGLICAIPLTSLITSFLFMREQETRKPSSYQLQSTGDDISDEI